VFKLVVERQELQSRIVKTIKHNAWSYIGVRVGVSEKYNQSQKGFLDNVKQGIQVGPESYLLYECTANSVD